MLVVHFLLGAAIAQIELPSIPNCGLPADPACLVRNAQYTVVGTITNTFMSETNASPNRFNATMNIRCVWSSFSSPVSPGQGLVGQNLLVTNFGTNSGRCPPGTGALAAVNDTKIYFIYVARRPPANGAASQAIFGVQNICVGGIDLANKAVVERVLADSPENRISDANRGSDAFCALSTPSGGSGNTPSPSGSSAPQFTSNGYRQTVGAFAAFMVAAIALSL
jgi:hypothetical protein